MCARVFCVFGLCCFPEDKEQEMENMWRDLPNKQMRHEGENFQKQTKKRLMTSPKVASSCRRHHPPITARLLPRPGNRPFVTSPEARRPLLCFISSVRGESPQLSPAVQRLEAIKHQEIFLSVNVEDINMHKLADCCILLNTQHTRLQGSLHIW